MHQYILFFITHFWLTRSTLFLLETATRGTTRGDTVRILMERLKPQPLDYKSSALAIELNSSKLPLGRNQVYPGGLLWALMYRGVYPVVLGLRSTEIPYFSVCNFLRFISYPGFQRSLEKLKTGPLVPPPIQLFLRIQSEASIPIQGYSVIGQILTGDPHFCNTMFWLHFNQL